jgi:hypothetical protein
VESEPLQPRSRRTVAKAINWIHPPSRMAAICAFLSSPWARRTTRIRPFGDIPTGASVRILHPPILRRVRATRRRAGLRWRPAAAGHRHPALPVKIGDISSAGRAPASGAAVTSGTSGAGRPAHSPRARVPSCAAAQELRWRARGGRAPASGASGEDRRHLRRRPAGGWRRHPALPVKTGDLSGAGAGAFSSRQSKPLRRRTRELRLVELGEPAASPKGTRRRRKAWHKWTCPRPRQG